MKAGILLATLLVVFVPSLAVAECYGGHEAVTMSCPEGQSFDQESKTCTTPTG